MIAYQEANTVIRFHHNPRALSTTDVHSAILLECQATVATSSYFTKWA